MNVTFYVGKASKPILKDFLMSCPPRAGEYVYIPNKNQTVLDCYLVVAVAHELASQHKYTVRIKRATEEV
jgi:hypothetical protein